MIKIGTHSIVKKKNCYTIVNKTLLNYQHVSKNRQNRTHLPFMVVCTAKMGVVLAITLENRARS